MTYYATVSLTLKDDSWVENYLGPVTALVHKHGGRYLARTPELEKIEGGGPPPDIFVIIEWPSKDAAQAFYKDPEYQPYLTDRLAGAGGEFLLIAGKDIAAG